MSSILQRGGKQSVRETNEGLGGVEMERCGGRLDCQHSAVNVDFYKGREFEQKIRL